jgi:hypothetical protein
MRMNGLTYPIHIKISLHTRPISHQRISHPMEYSVFDFTSFKFLAGHPRTPLLPALPHAPKMHDEMQ